VGHAASRAVKFPHAQIHRDAARRKRWRKHSENGSPARNLREDRVQKHQTYVQSGNIVFECNRSASGICTLLEKSLKGETRLPVPVIVRTPAELKKIISGCPFLKEKGIDLTRLYITFLAEEAGKDASAKLAGLKAGADRFHVVGGEVYLHCPVSYGESKLSNNALQKALGITATTRNWNTVNKLYEMAQ
jgi:uncharacterized protein (DUF1697 family)